MEPHAMYLKKKKKTMDKNSTDVIHNITLQVDSWSGRSLPLWSIVLFFLFFGATKFTLLIIIMLVFIIHVV